MGVGRIYDRDGRLLDATLFLGGGTAMRFGRAQRDYDVERMTLTMVGLPELTIWRARWGPQRVCAGGFISTVPLVFT